MIRTLTILGLIVAVAFTTLLAGCATSSTPNSLSGQQVRHLNDKQRPI